MSNYTLHSLSDVDFENLVSDLLDKELGLRFQPFARGRDSGVDLLHGSKLDGETVEQCKHYCRSKFSNLKHSLKKTELPKIETLKPERYILATSLSLSTGNKQELLEILTPYCKTMEDIYGLEGIQKLIRKNPDVEKAHHKLWLTSTAVLTRILHNGQAVWNELSKEDIERKLSLYVQTAAYEKGMELLAKYHACILSGIPGIGKTTLAQVLVTRLMDQGYDLITARNDISEAITCIDPTKNQVIFYDDFLGQSSLSEKLNKNEDAGILRLLLQARKSKNLRIILATREYILNEAKQLYEKLSTPAIDVPKCIVQIEDYTKHHKAKVLYNHLYFSELSDEHVQAIVHNKTYLKIINHKHYFPRAIEWMTIGGGDVDTTPENYPGLFLQSLDDPNAMWDHAFNQQISEDARSILYCLALNEGLFGLGELKKAWARLNGLDDASGSSIESIRLFNNALDHIEGTFTQSVKSSESDQIAVGFHNPSVMDYIRLKIAGDKSICYSLLQNAVFYEQVSCLLRLNSNGRIEKHPAGLVELDDRTISVIEGTVLAEAASYYRIQYRADNAVRLVQRDRVCERLTEMARWSGQLENDPLMPIAISAVSKLHQSGELERIIDHQITGFLDAMHENQSLTGDCLELLKSCVDMLADKIDWEATTDEWLIWVKFVNECSYFSNNGRRMWADKADQFCDLEIDNLFDATNGPEEAWQFLDELKEISSTLGGSWHIDTSSQDEKISDMEAQREELADMQREEDRIFSLEREQDSDEDIDDMFQSFDGRIS
ncbi:MAG: ATP-binding protein [Magnetovibrio sp.]|nr:ATP-binding protein [Magnetovibrio sp.]